MVRNNFSFFASINWFIENDQAWFIANEYNALFRLDMNTNQCKLVAELPEVNGDKLNIGCIKYGNDIFCMPFKGDRIWIYQLDRSQFFPIRIIKPDNTNILIRNFWRVDDKIFAVSKGLKQIIEINIRNRRIDNYYNFCSVPDAKIALSIKVEDTIYSASATANQVYSFNIKTKETEMFTIPGIEGGFRTISFDGENFWMSGFRKEIYVWNKQNDTVRTINKFSRQFVVYCGEDTRNLLDGENIIYDKPIFNDSVKVGQYIWFIPRQTNKMIYVDKDTYAIYYLDLETQMKWGYSFPAQDMKGQYSLAYVIENRYIGIYSFMENCMMEIDTEGKKAVLKKYLLDSTCLHAIEKFCHMDGEIIYDAIYDKRSVCRMILEMKLSGSFLKGKKTIGNIGENIYRKLMY